MSRKGEAQADDGADPPAKEFKLEHGLTLLRQQLNRPVRFQYTLENGNATYIDLHVSLENSLNLIFEDDTDAQEVHVSPHETVALPLIVMVDPKARWALKPTISWIEVLPSKEELAMAEKRDRNRIKADIKAFRKLPLADEDDSLSVLQLERILEKENQKFVDLEFPPCDGSLWEPDSDFKNNPVLSWRRAAEVFGDSTQLFVDGVNPGDIKQGRLGDCWLMCALASLAEHEELVYNMFTLPGHVDPQRVNGAGVYDVLLYKDGEKRYVRLDDYVPCIPGAGVVYAQNLGSELWVLLVEKAFAKLAGNYDALRGGLCWEALMDLTGCPTKTVTLAACERDEIWHMMETADVCKNIMSGSVPGEDKWSNTAGQPTGEIGLISGHAYSIIRARQTSHGHRLLQLRNPWGKFEWSGDWSDESHLWTASVVDELEATFNGDDGLFWMSLDDFCHHFTKLNICHLRPSSGGKWFEHRIKNHFFFQEDIVDCGFTMVECTQPTSMCIGVHQRDERAFMVPPYIDLGVVILKVTEDGQFPLVDVASSADRDVQLDVKLPPGRYVLVPMTTGIRRKAAAQEFMSRRQKQQQRRIRAPGGGAELSYACSAAVREIFWRLDEDMDQLLNSTETGKLFLHLTEKPLTDRKYVELVSRYDSKGRLGLSADGLVQFFEDQEDKMIKRYLQRAGYDEDLYLDYARTFITSVHAASQVLVSKLDYNDDLFKRAVGLWILSRSGPPKESGKIKVYDLDRGTAGASIAVFNGFDRAVEVTMDCSKSKNIVSHRGSLTATSKVPPQEMRVVHHIAPEDPFEQWAYSYDMSGKLV
eukprot:m.475737 g.475737  ORF g.475737 m.475737 type:complete len:816 (+) comp20398_c0_seq15:196-2643(+)